MIVHTTLEKCSGCGKWKVIGVQEVTHGFIPATGSNAFALLWDTVKKLCPTCNPANTFGPRQAEASERLAVRHWWTALPVIELPRGVYVSNSNLA